MKPVQLLPSDVKVVAEPGSVKPNYGMIGGAALGVLAVVGVAAYFALARVDSVTSETQRLQAEASSATQQAAAARSQVASLGQPVVDSDRQLAQGAEQVLIAAYTERHDFVLLSRELQGIMKGTGGWYTSVKASAAGGADGASKAVEIEGYMPSEELAASFNERADATLSLSSAETVQLDSERLTNPTTKRAGIYWKFKLTADLADLVAPSAGGGGGDGADATVVGSGGDGSLTLSLDPEPIKATPKPKKQQPAKPKNPFAVAASSAGGAS